MGLSKQRTNLNALRDCSGRNKRCRVQYKACEPLYNGEPGNQRKMSLQCFHESFRLNYIVDTEDTDGRH